MSICRIILFATILPFGTISLTAQTNVPTGNYGNDRTNANPNETVLTHQAVGGSGFGKLGAFAVDGQIYAQPLYIGGLQIPNQGTKNVVFVATMNDSVYAIDADNSAASTPLWQVSLGSPVPSASVPDLEDVNPQVGILSTPTIDVGGQALFAVAETFEKGAPIFRLHALSLLDGHEMNNGPVVIAGSVAGSGDGAVNGTVNFDPFWHLQRPGLALANGNVYICFGSHGDAGDYHGWVMAYRASNLQQQTAVFNTTPNGNGGGIWQSGHAPMTDSAGNIYVISGNGDYDGVANFSGAVIKLSPGLSVIDWYTPAQWQYLDANDLDVGSTGAILAAGGSLMLAGDKGGYLLNLSTSQLGHVENAAGANDFSASTSGIFDLALWQSDQGSLLFEHDWNGALKAYPVTATGITQMPVSTGTWAGDSLYQGLAVSSNGSADGIVWETTGNHAQAGVPGTLHAWNASDLTQELYNSNTQPADVLGGFAKFVSPLVANGRVYVPTFSNQLVIYGLNSSSGAPSLAPQVASVLNGASFVQNAVSPGEVLAVFGTNLGPATLETAQVVQNSDAPGPLAGTQILFDGIAAPLLYASASQVGVVVPFGVTGTTQMVVQNSAGQSSAASLPVVAATPALFTSSALGNGQASAVNEDGTVNSSTNPAAAGTVVALYATGLGQTNPPGVDGGIASAVLPVPILPVSVLVGGLPAYVLYAGAAPGSIAGVFQINVRIPPLAPVGSTILVVIHGNFVSGTDVWIAVN